MNDINQFITVAFGVTGLGAVLVKVVEWFLKRGDREIDEASAIRKELREEVRELKKELNEQEEKIRKRGDDLDEWKSKYYDLTRQHNELKLENEKLDQLVKSMDEKIKSLELQILVLQRLAEKDEESKKNQ